MAVRVMRIIARLNVGGPALHCLLLSHHLRAYGFETTLVTGQPAVGEESYESLFQDKLDLSTVSITRLQRLTRLPSVLGDLSTLWELVKIMRRERPRIVHTHTAKAGVLGRLAALISGVPVIVHTFHGHVLRGYFSPLVSRLITYVEQALARGSSAIVTLSPALKRELSRGFRVASPRRFHIIPLGRDLDAFFRCQELKGQLREELGIAAETPLIGCVGRLVPIKDHATLFEAFAQMQRAPGAPRRVLLVIGEGELGESLRQHAARLDLGDQVRFLGWRSDLPKIYADLDLLALSSRNEGTPLAMIEAFAASCPVVATRVGGVPDMFGPALEGSARSLELRPEGCVVPPGDATAFAAGMRSLLEDSARREACAKAASVAGRRYTAEALAERMARLYQSLLTRRS